MIFDRITSDVLYKHAVKTVSLLIVFIYMIVPVLMFGHMEHMIDSHMMGEQNCLYLTGNNSVCPMNFPVHLNVLQNGVITPLFFKFSIIYYTFLFSVFIYIPLGIIKFFLYFKKHRYRDIPILFKDLFSQGILNGKAF